MTEPQFGGTEGPPPPHQPQYQPPPPGYARRRDMRRRRSSLDIHRRVSTASIRRLTWIRRRHTAAIR